MNTEIQLSRYRRHLVIYTDTLFALLAMGECATVAVSATLRRIEETLAAMDALIPQEVSAQ